MRRGEGILKREIAVLGFPGGASGEESVFLPGKFHGQRSQVGYSPCGHKESDMTELLSPHYFIYISLHLYIHTYTHTHTHTHIYMGFPGSSAGKESTYQETSA